MRKLILFAVLATVLCCNTFGQSAIFHVDSLNTLYSKGMLAYNEHNYEQAIKMLNNIPLEQELKNKRDTIIGQVAETIAKCYYELKKYDEAIPYAEKASSVYKSMLGEEDPIYVTSLSFLSGCYSFSGNNEEAVKIGSKVVEIRKKILGTNHPDYATALDYLAGYYAHLGKFEEAVELDLEAVRIRKKILGKNHPDYVISLHDLAFCYSRLGKYQEAFTYGKESVEIAKRIYGTKSKDYLTNLQHYCQYYYLSGNYSEAVKIGKEIIQTIKDIYGTESYQYATSLNNQAAYNARSGQFGEAIKLVKEASSIYERVVGTTHSDYITSLDNLAAFNAELGNYAEAIKLSEKVIELRESTVGKEHPSYALALNNISSYYSFIGEIAKAIDCGTRAVDIYLKITGKEDPSYAMAMANLANIYNRDGKYELSIQLCTEATEIYKKLLGEKHPYYAHALSNLAGLYNEIGNYNKAKELNIKVADIRKEVLGENHIDYATTLFNLASCYTNEGDYEAAMQDLLKVRDIYTITVGREHPYYALLLKKVADLCFSSGNDTVALDYSKRALSLLEKTSGRKSTEYAYALEDLAYYSSGTNNNNEALEYEKQATAILSEVVGKDHPDYASSLGSLANYNFKLHNYDACSNLLIERFNLSYKDYKKNFSWMNSSLRQKYWENNKTFFTEDIPYKAFIISSDTLNSLCYNAALFSKGILLELQSSLHKTIVESNDQEMISLYYSLRNTQALLRKQLEEKVDNRTLNVDSLQNVCDNLESSLMKKSKEFGDYTHNISIRWKDVKAALDKNATAIEFLSFPAGEDSIEYIALIINSEVDSPKMVRLGLENEMLAYSNNMYKKNSNNQLYDIIWKNLERYIKNESNVYFSPSGILYQLNIETLKDSTGTMARDKYNLYRLSSTRELCMQTNELPTKSAVLYGNLNYSMDSSSLISSAKQSVNDRYYIASRGYNPENSTRGAWNNLEATKKEIETIAEELKKDKISPLVIEGNDGTEESFKNLDGQKKSIIHLATHGFFLKDQAARRTTYLNRKLGNEGGSELDLSMKRSGLLFSGANITWLGNELPKYVEDGILLAEEISSLNLQGCNLLILSACETGLGEVSSEGVFGLQRGFKQAGVKTIVMSLWKVDDIATQIFMSNFYKYLAKGKSKHQAFLKAQDYLRKSKDYNDPKYWAAFIMLDAI